MGQWVDRRDHGLFDQLAEALNQPVWMVQGNGEVYYANRAWREFTGLSLQSNLGMENRFVLHGEDRARWSAFWERLVQDRISAEIDVRLRRHDGVFVPARVLMQPVSGQDESVTGWLAIATGLDPARGSLAIESIKGPTTTGAPVAPVTVAGLGKLDLEENQQSLSRLEQGPEHGNAVLDHVFAFVGVLTPDGVLIEANRPALEAAALTRHDVLGRSFWDCYWWNHDPTLQDKVRDACLRAAQGELIRFDVEVRMAEGLPMAIDFMLAPLRDSTGRITHLVPSAVDITARRRAERASRESEAMARRRLAELEATYDTAPIGLGVFDLDLRWVRINGKLAEMNGFPPSAHLGRRVGELLPDLAGQAEEMLRRITASGRPILGMELTGQTPAQPGVIRTWVESFFPLTDPSGNIIGINVVCEEISERKRSHEALLESEERFRNLADNAPVMIWMTDTEHRCTYLNRQWYQLTGQTPQTGLGHGWRDALHPDDRDATWLDFLACCREARAFRRDFRVLHRDGSYRWCAASGISRQGPSGEPIGSIGSIVDISERKQAEDALKEADRKKDEFLAVLAHELRNPLAAIRNANSVAGLCELSEDAAWANEVIDRQTRNLTRLIDDLLDLTRINQGKVRLRMQRIPLRRILELAVESVRPAVNQQGHVLRVDLGGESLPVQGDPTRLEQVFTNILSNATKYTPRGGLIELIAGSEGGMAVVKIRDTGSGIPPDMLDRIFVLFAQVDENLRLAQGGLGIGLSVVQGLVLLHGGSIEAYSDGPGQGSTFTIRIPLSCESPGEVVLTGDRPGSSTSTPAPPHLRRPCQVLLVDDNRDAAQSLGRLLQEHGLSVVFAHDGPEALAVANERSPDAIVLDIRLPGISGLEVARRLSAGRSEGKPLIIALSGLGQEKDREASQRSGFDHHLIKPVDLEILIPLLLSAAPA